MHVEHERGHLSRVQIDPGTAAGARRVTGGRRMRAPKIDYSCPRAWASLAGDDGQRHCSQCDQTVTNLSAMTPSAARGFVDQHPTACLRFVADERGRVVFERRRLAVLATAASIAGCTAWHESEDVVAPPDALAIARDDAGIPDEEPADTAIHARPSSDQLDSISTGDVAAVGARPWDGPTAVAAAYDPDPPRLERRARPIPKLSRRELRRLRLRYRQRGFHVEMMGR